MGQKSKIEWTDATWNPVMGCEPVSRGCDNCYAREMMRRFAGRPGWPSSPSKVTTFPDRLDQPKRWRRPRRIFVCSMGDLFHDSVSDGFIERVLTVIQACPQHAFFILTKRPKRLREFSLKFENLWVGVSVEDQITANGRIPFLLNPMTSKMCHRFVSCEPLLGPVNLRFVAVGHGGTLDALTGDARTAKGEIYTGCHGLNWVICGGESGRDARPMRPEWACSLRDQCSAVAAPFFFKQWGEWGPWGPAALIRKRGKKATGHLLNGVEHFAFPEELEDNHAE